jgi:hypothetical protein
MNSQIDAADADKKRNQHCPSQTIQFRGSPMQDLHQENSQRQVDNGRQHGVAAGETGCGHFPQMWNHCGAVPPNEMLQNESGKRSRRRHQDGQQYHFKLPMKPHESSDAEQDQHQYDGTAKCCHVEARLS